MRPYRVLAAFSLGATTILSTWGESAQLEPLPLPTETIPPAQPIELQAIHSANQPSTSATDYVVVEINPLTEQYQLRQYAIKVLNKRSVPIEVLQFEVLNGITHQNYYQILQQYAQGKRRFAGGLIRSAAGLASSLIPYSSYAAYTATQYAAGTTASVVENTGLPTPDTEIVQRADQVMLSPNQYFRCTIVVPDPGPPSVRLFVKDLQTNQIFEWTQQKTP